MEFILTRKQDQMTTEWSGGTTTQLAIYPAGSSLKEISFLFRLSTAKVIAEESRFSTFPGVTRVIMVLEGEVTLEHKGHHTKQLQSYETDVFSGDWETISRGKIIDFNLMMKGSCAGSLDMVKTRPAEVIKLDFRQPVIAKGIYFFKGSATVASGSFQEKLETGDFLLIMAHQEAGSIRIEPLNPGVLIISNVTSGP